MSFQSKEVNGAHLLRTATGLTVVESFYLQETEEVAGGGEEISGGEAERGRDEH